MVIEDVKPNSHKYKEEQENSVRKKNEQIVKGGVKVRQKNIAAKLADIFLPEDVEDVKKHIVTDIVIPKVKQIMQDTIDVFLWGEGTRSKSSSSTKVSYWASDKQSSPRTKERSGFSVNEIVIANRAEAEEVLNSMDELISRFGAASVLDLYEFVGMQADWTDNKYGWTDFRNASIVRVRDGYMLKLPRATLL